MQLGVSKGWKVPDKIELSGDKNERILKVYEGQREQVYKPFEDHGLYLRFANTPTDEKDILEFARKYGLLGYTVEEETVKVWQEEISKLQLATEIYALSQDDPKELLRRIEWEDGNYRYTGTVNQLVIQSPKKGLIVPTTLIVKDNIVTFNPYSPLQENNGLHEVLFFVWLTSNNRLENSVEPFMSLNDDKLDFGIEAHGLLSAFWLQFAESIREKRKFKRCLGCDTWFELGQQLSRTSKLYCSNACRVRTHRERQKEAKELYDSGTTVEAIAAQLKTDVEIVKGWVK